MLAVFRIKGFIIHIVLYLSHGLSIACLNLHEEQRPVDDTSVKFHSRLKFFDLDYLSKYQIKTKNLNILK